MVLQCVLLGRAGGSGGARLERGWPLDGGWRDAAVCCYFGWLNFRTAWVSTGGTYWSAGAEDFRYRYTAIGDKFDGSSAGAVDQAADAGALTCASAVPPAPRGISTTASRPTSPIKSCKRIGWSTRRWHSAQVTRVGSKTGEPSKAGMDQNVHSLIPIRTVHCMSSIRSPASC